MISPTGAPAKNADAQFYLRKIASWILRAEPILLLLIAPALLFPSPGLTLFLIALPMMWLSAWLASGHVVPRTPLDVALALLLGMILISLFATFDIGFSLPKVTGVLLGVGAYYAIVRKITSSAQLRLAILALILAGAGLALIGLVGINWLQKWPVLSAIVQRLPRLLRGLPGAEEGFSPNAVAGSLVLVIPIPLFWLAASRHSSAQDPTGADSTALGPAARIALVVGLAISLATLLLTQSRGAWTGLLLAMAVVLSWRSARWRVVALITIAGLSLLMLVVGPSRLLAFILPDAGAGLANSVAGRQEIWSRALLVIQDFPLSGIGMNAFRRIVPALYPTFVNPQDFDVASAHNHLLQAALDLGLPGLGAYVALWLGAAAMLIQVRRRSPAPEPRAFVDGLAAGLLAHFIFSLTDAIPLGAKVGLFFWLVLGIVASLYRLAPRV